MAQYLAIRPLEDGLTLEEYPAIRIINNKKEENAIKEN